jgi:hypothetical protein
MDMRKGQTTKVSANINVCEVTLTKVIDNLDQSLMHISRIFKRQLKK